MNPENILQGEKVRLTALEKEDMKSLSLWVQNTHTYRLFDAVPAYPKPARKWEEWLEEDDKSDSQFSFAIRPLEDDRLIGFCMLEGILWNMGAAWLAIVIGDPEDRGKGHGREAMKLLLRYSFDELNLYRIQLTVFEYNEKAMNLYEQLGFRREGAFREFLHRDGKRYDMYLYGLLRPEWEAQERAS